jgi:hypothetical protein
MLKAVSLVLFLFSTLAFVTNCSKNSTGTNQDLTSNISGTWRGDYFTAAKNDSGTFIVEITRHGEGFSGEAVLKSSIRNEPHYLFIKGTVSKDEISIELNKDEIPYQITFMLQAVLIDSQHFAGDFFYSPENLNAVIRCEKLKKGSCEIIDLFEVPNTTVISMAFDGSNIWLSTVFNDYIKLSTASIMVIDTVVVYDEKNQHWTSDALTSDRIFLWGHLPLVVSNRVESRIIKFNKAGAIVNIFQIPHRTSGLAFDGNLLWTLNESESKLYQFDDSGNIYKNLYINLPDVIQLEYGQNHFWSLGWFFKKLFKIDKTGKVMAVYDLPEGPEYFSQAGIAFDGTYFWYARNYDPPISHSTIYRLLLD